MKIVLEIPKEFEDHFNKDHFNDSLSRLIYDIRAFEEEGLYEGLAGNYEFETLEMLITALKMAVPTSTYDKLYLNSVYGKCARSTEYLEEDEELLIDKAQFEKFNKSCKKEGD